MEISPFPLEQEADAGTAPLDDLGTQGDQQGFDPFPVKRHGNRDGKDRGKGFPVFVVHGQMLAQLASNSNSILVTSEKEWCG